MNQQYRQQPAHSPVHQNVVRAEINRQIEEYLQRGGKIEQLTGPSLQPHRAVRVGPGALSEAL